MLRKTTRLLALSFLLIILPEGALAQGETQKSENEDAEKSKKHKTNSTVKIEKIVLPSEKTVAEEDDDRDDKTADDKPGQTDSAAEEKQTHQGRRRIVTAEDIKKRRSAIGGFLMKPFRAIAPAASNGMTIFEEEKQYLILFGPTTFPINPLFGGVTEDSGFGVGFTASTKDYLSKDFRLVGSSLVTTKRYVRNTFGLEITPQKFADKKLEIKLIGQQLLLSQEDFYGAGANSVRGDETTYYHRQLGAKLSIGFELSKHLKFGAFSEFTKNDITEGGGDLLIPITARFNAVTLPGLDRNIRLLDSGFFVQAEHLDEPENPHSGWSTRFDFSNADSFGRNDFGWINYKVDARTYIPLGNKLRVIALRFLGDFKDPKGNSDIPVFKLARLGNAETLRGYDTFRFQGINSMHLNVEYRFRLMQGFETSGFTGVEGVFFGDFGQVYNNYDELKWRNVRGTWGGGFRIMSRSSVALTLLYAQSPERGGIFWRFGKTF